MRVLGVLTATALMFSFAWPASATAADVVSIPGFEQGCCGANTPDVCGWNTRNNSDGSYGRTGP
jgi:hypothetical protein